MGSALYQRIRASGKIKYGFCYGKTYREAKEKVNKCKAALVNGKPIPDTNSRTVFRSTVTNGFVSDAEIFCTSTCSEIFVILIILDRIKYRRSSVRCFFGLAFVKE